MKLSTESLARSAARHPWRTIAAWVGASVVAFGLVAVFLGDGLTTDAEVTNDPESLRALDLLFEAFPQPDFVNELVVVEGENAVPAADALAAELHASGAIAGAERAAVSPGEDAALVTIRMGDNAEDEIERVIEIVESAEGGGVATAIAGDFTLDRDFQELSDRDLRNGELRYGLPAALVVIVLVFGALVAASLPVVLALVSIAVALGLTAAVSAGFELSIFVVNMLTGMGLALGIDYALFVASRFREERAAGRVKEDAIAVAGATASRAVLFSGSAFVLAMTGLLLVQSTIMRSLALGAILVGMVSVVAALTLLPAILSLLGDRVNRLRVLPLGHGESRLWGGIAARVARRPALSLALATAALLAAAAPLVTMDIGAAGVSTLPDETVSKRGFLALERSFPTVSEDPVEVAIVGDARSPEVAAAVERLQVALRSQPIFGETSLALGESGVGRLTIQLGGDPLGEPAVEAVRDLRSELIPAAFEGVPAEALVAGATAENIDYFDVMERWLPLVIVFVLGLSFLLLTVAFRSVVVPATAIVLNLLSVGATYGLLVAVFQHGFLNEVFGFVQVDNIEAWVPLFLFAVLFGLSMDYQVFLLSRIRERFTETGDTARAIAFGVGSTGRIITGAALIIVAVFAGFAAGDLVMFQQMGFGIAVALLVDATVVRSVLVPAAMTLLGRANWYLPRWLDWLPHVEVEGHAEEDEAHEARPAHAA